MKKKILKALGISLLSLICAGVLLIASVIIAGTAWESGTADSLTVFYNKVTRECMAAYFEWDGNPSNTVFTVPDEFEGVPIKSLGGAVGRAPTLFFVQLPEEKKEGAVSVAHSAELKGKTDENTETITFTVKLGKNIRRFGDFVYEEYFEDENGKVLYIVKINYECSPENPRIYSKDGKLYSKMTDKLID